MDCCMFILCVIGQEFISCASAINIILYIDLLKVEYEGHVFL